MSDGESEEEIVLHFSDAGREQRKISVDAVTSGNAAKILVAAITAIIFLLVALLSCLNNRTSLACSF